ncbi:hypothetical protein FPOA_11617 [Fusarium poae]|uniref:Uncharacterized protein n=1 Tax=Fusarium poae TaxID=36050 RepID=A0A1B8AH85_FUSPO|nr:hypothetical protein FPOA_11617 [Fusarium poae]
MSVPRPNTPEMQDLLKEFLHENVARQYPAMRELLVTIMTAQHDTLEIYGDLQTLLLSDIAKDQPEVVTAVQASLKARPEYASPQTLLSADEVERRRDLQSWYNKN